MPSTGYSKVEVARVESEPRSGEVNFSIYKNSEIIQHIQSVFTHVASIYTYLLEQKKAFA